MDREGCDWSFATDSRALAEESWSRMLSENHLLWSLDELDWSGMGFSATVRRRALCDLVLVDCECDPSAGHRGTAQLAETDDAYLVLLLTVAGEEVVEQSGQQASLRPGSIVVWDSEKPAAFHVESRLRKRSLIMPKSALAEVGVRGQLQTGRVLDDRAPAVRLLSAYLEALSGTIDTMPLGTLPAARNATIELVTAALQVEAASPASPTVIRSAAERYIHANLRNPQLSPTSVAGEVGVSVRTLHRAFAGTDRSLAELIRTGRLAAARDDLLAGSPVGSVARRWQFSDASHFSRAFKRHFGFPPSDLADTTAGV